jgi:transcriptional regulator with XRE-family HTH domain
MWLDNLKELKKRTGMTSKQIAEVTRLPERTIIRIFSGDTDNPYMDTLHRIVTALDGSLDDIFADTKVVVATQSLVEIKETADVAEAERDLVIAENEMLKNKAAALATEVELLKKELQHKEELLAVYNFFTKTRQQNEG